MNYGVTEAQCILTAGWLTATFYGLLALWAPAGRIHWFWHVTPLALALAALAPMGGVPPLLIFGSQAAGVIASCVLAAIVHSRFAASPLVRSIETPRWRFTLRDGVLAVLLTASTLAIARNVPYRGDAVITLPWWRYTLTGLAFAGCTCAAFTLIAGRPRWYWRLLGAVLLLGTSPLLLYFGDIFELFLPYLEPLSFTNLQGTAQSQSPEWLVGLAIGHFWMTAIWLLLLCLGGWAWWPPRPSARQFALLNWQRFPRARRIVQVTASVLLFVNTLVLVGCVIDIYWNLLPPSAPPTAALPVPNGIDELEPVEKLINWSAIPTQDPDDVSDFACGKFVEQNAEPLRRIRQSLEIPWTRKLDFYDTETFYPEIVVLRTWSRVLNADARYQSAIGRPDLAARDYLDIVRFSILTGRGGAGLDATIADAIRGIGLSEIAAQLDKFDEITLREISYTLELLEGVPEPIAEVWQRDLYFQRFSSGWIGRVHFWAESQATSPQPSALSSMTLLRRQADAKQRLLMLEAAIRAFQLRHGQLPTSLDALVPEYLSAIPADPFGKGPPVYRRTESGYLLYSVGGNGIDDGGQRATSHGAVNRNVGDLFFDASTAVF